jgi:PucR family transcriptional regulator, purine catabolism regulatory protein
VAAAVRDLLANPSLALTLLTAKESLPPGALEEPVAWVHSSDLLDPTPFLEQGHVLLITGSQFPAEPSEAELLPYAERLRRRGVVALGFGTELVRSGTPEALVAACTAVGLPLFEVPYRIPFIAIAQYAAGLVAEEANARRNWALKAQRAISLAALRPNGLTATLGEASRQLDRWVVLIDAGGGIDRMHPEGPDPAVLAEVRKHAAGLLARRRRSSSTFESGHQHVLLQTLGAGRNLRGVLVVGGAARLDDAGQQVVDGVVAMAGLALEASHELDRARSLLRTGLWHALLAGEVPLVRDVAGEVWSSLPADPVSVVAARVPPGSAEGAAELLEGRAADRPGTLFFAVLPSGLALCCSAAQSDLPELLADRFGATVGVSNPVALTALPTGYEQALEAQERARAGGRSVVHFRELTEEGVLALLTRTDVSRVAEAMLAPLLRHDEEHGGALVPSLRVWLEHDGHAEEAATLLGVHRHTLRARIQTCARLLGRDLDAFPARADVWAALLALDPAVRPR